MIYILQSSFSLAFIYLHIQKRTEKTLTEVICIVLHLSEYCHWTLVRKCVTATSFTVARSEDHTHLAGPAKKFGTEDNKYTIRAIFACSGWFYCYVMLCFSCKVLCSIYCILGQKRILQPHTWTRWNFNQDSKSHFTILWLYGVYSFLNKIKKCVMCQNVDLRFKRLNCICNLYFIVRCVGNLEGLLA